MNTKKWVLIVVAAVLALTAAVVFFVRRVHYVDPRPAIALGGEYFSKLKSGQIDEAAAMYGDEFRRNYETSWRKLLVELDSRFGEIAAFTLLDAKVVPQTSPAGEIACVAVRYNVSRSPFPVEERLLVCPQQAGKALAITGHEVTRLDTGQTIAAGATVKEVEVFSFGAKANPETNTDFDIARKAADELYSRISGEAYGAIWDAAHDDLKRSASREQMVTMLRQWNEKLGACRQPMLIDTDYANKDGEHFVGLVYSRPCQNGTATERLAWKIVGGKALLRSYH